MKPTARERYNYDVRHLNLKRLKAALRLVQVVHNTGGNVTLDAAIMTAACEVLLERAVTAQKEMCDRYKENP